MERPSGPMGTATQATGGQRYENGPSSQRSSSAQGVRRPSNVIRHEPSNSSISSIAPATAAQIVAIATEAMKIAVEENRSKAQETSGMSTELKPGVTLDLSHKGIQKEFPEEVVDIIKHELERLALSHNQISTFPARFAECASLRYLNVRSNVIRDFPQAICALTALEILDLGRNKLRLLPAELAQLTSLKVLSIQKNRIEDLPLCLADMSSLQVLKLDGNPIRFPPKEVMQPQATTPPNGGYLKESEMNDVQITAQIKRFLKQHKVSQDRSETESGGEESSEGGETPRPMRRVMSGRFPIKVNGNDMAGDLRSPSLPRPPPIPSRSHQRGLSAQNAALRRPSVAPLTLGNPNERMRSNSESLIQQARDRNLDRSDRARRQGLMSRKPNELSAVDEARNNRYSHLRGLSHGSALHPGHAQSMTSLRSPMSPGDGMPRPTYIRRLSSLPERKRASTAPDPIVEGAKGILYALFQIHPLIQSLMGLSRDESSKRSSLERVFYNATQQVEELDRDILAYENYSEEDEEVSPRSNETVHSACLTCLSAYTHVCSLLGNNIDALLDKGEPRYIRTLLLNLYGSIAEVRNAGLSLFPRSKKTKAAPLPTLIENTLRPRPRDKSLTPTRDRPGLANRSRSATALPASSGLRLATGASRLPAIHSSGRSATMTSMTPRSGESFSSDASAKTHTGPTYSEEDRMFERIFLGMKQSVAMAIVTLPVVQQYFLTTMKAIIQQGDPNHLKKHYQEIIQNSQLSTQAAEALKIRLSTIKLNETGIRTERAFWEMCNGFMTSYFNLVHKVKEVKTLTNLVGSDIIAKLKPLQQVIRSTGQLWHVSPWSFVPSSAPIPQTVLVPQPSVFPLQSPAVMPMTPASAALGPAVQATVPSGMAGTPYSAMFNGNVFERADVLLSSNGPHSRTGTMTSSFGSTIDSTTSMGTVLSPNTSIGSSRFTGSTNGKVTF